MLLLEKIEVVDEQNIHSSTPHFVGVKTQNARTWQKCCQTQLFLEIKEDLPKEQVKHPKGCNIT